MSYNLNEIGNKIFIEKNGYVVSIKNINGKESEKENLEKQYERYCEKYGEEEGFKKIIEGMNMRKRNGWVGYKYEGHFLNILEEDGYGLSLPSFNQEGKRIKMEIVYWKEDEEGKYYRVLKNGEWEGTIINKEKEAKEFYEEFFSEMLFENFVLEEDSSQCLFANIKLREKFNFLPALVTINQLFK